MKKITLLAIIFFRSLLIIAQDNPKGLNVNDMAPEFSAIDQNGKSFDLNNEIKKGSVIIVFYRGQWCPYCNKQLKELEDSLSLITAKGATLVAITPEKSENIHKTIEKTKATYPIIFDDGLAIMKSYDVAYALDENMVAKYKGYGIDFTNANGTNNGTHLPVPAVYIVDKTGKIIFRHFDKDYTKRTSVAEILQHL